MAHGSRHIEAHSACGGKFGKPSKVAAGKTESYRNRELGAVLNGDSDPRPDYSGGKGRIKHLFEGQVSAKVVDSSGLAAGTVTASCTITIRPAPNFSISASPASLSIVQGSAGTSLITTNALYGFAGSIKLQQSGAPTGTSVTFLPASVSTGSTSQMQVTVGSSTAAGTYPVAVTGMSGALSHMTTVSLTVTASPLKPSATPSSLSFGTVRRFSLHFKSVTLKNTGTAAVTISGVSVTPGAGTDPHDFTPISLCGRTLEAGRSCEIVVVLFAEHLGSLSATLNIPNDAVTSPQSVSLSAGVIQYWWGQPMESPAKQP
ncbi:MAG: choice-of-anchor D domain-containing protein [Steroidobacteraceae bacterium]|jgi:hypothetical protein